MKAYLALSSFVVAVITLFFLVAVILRGIQKPKNLAFCAFAVSVFVWVLGHMFWQLAPDVSTATFWIRVLVVGSSFIPYTYFHFVCEVTGTRLSRFVIAGYIVAFFTASLAFTPLIIESVGPDLWPNAGPAFALYFGGFVVVVCVCFFLLIRQYLSAPTKIRNQNKYLIIGTAIGFLGGATNFPMWLDINIPPAGHGFSIFYILGIGYSVVKYRLLDFNELAIRSLGFTVTALVLAAPLGAAFPLVLSYYVADFEPVNFFVWWALMVAACAYVTAVGPRFSDFINVFIETRLAPGRYAYRRELRELCDSVLAGVEEEQIVDYTTAKLYRILGLEVAAIYLRSELEHNFTCKSFEGSDRGGRPNLDPGEFPALVDIIERQRGAVFLEEEMERSYRFSRSILPFLAKHKEIKESDVFVPIKAHGMLYGFLLLGMGGHGNILSDVDLILLENLGSQMGLALKSREIERLSNNVEKLLSLGTMAAGLSHELRNPLVSVKTLAALLHKNSSTLVLKPEFSATIQRDIKRITGIVEGVSAFAHETTASQSLVDLRKVVEEVGAIHEERLKAAGIAYAVSCERNLPHAVGNHDQLLQVFGNIVENALQAICEWEGRPANPAISVSVRRRGGSGGIAKRRWLEVCVADNGPGIPEEMQQRIFEPFVTSRDTGFREGVTGTGLGLAIVNKIVEVHQGAISVHSRAGGGAEFRVSIPCDREY